jgi:hypothetical protein
MQDDEALEGAEGNGDDLNIFRCAAHEDGAKEVISVPAICHDKVSKVRLEIARSHIAK